MRAAIRLTAALAAVSLGSAARAQTVAITGGTVYPVSGPRIENGTVLLRDGKVVAVGANVAVPAGAQRIDATGKTIVPGFINAHGHLNADPSNRPIPEKLAAQLRVYADYGVTAVVVLGLIARAVVDHRVQARRLADLEARGIRRRSAGRRTA
jgi:heme exporter protein CcmD